MAGSPDAAMGLLRDVWAPARQRAAQERDRLQAIVGEEGGNFDLAPWDWRHYAEKLRGPSTTSTRARSSRTCPSTA